MPRSGSPGSNKSSVRGRSASPRSASNDGRRPEKANAVPEQPKSSSDVAKLGKVACLHFAKDGTCKFGDTCRYAHEKDKKAFSVQSDAESEETSPHEEPDAEGTSCAAVPLGCHYSMIAVTAPVARPACMLEDAKSLLKNKELEGRGATLAKNKRITFGRTFGVQFSCDTINKKYAYQVARLNARTVRWSDARAEKAAWHLRLAQMIANELSREVFGNPNGLACAVQKDLMRWIIDSGSGFELI